MVPHAACTIEERDRQDYLQNLVHSFFKIRSDNIYMDSIENYYLVESMDAVYLLTRDLNYAAVKQTKDVQSQRSLMVCSALASFLPPKFTVSYRVLFPFIGFLAFVHLSCFFAICFSTTFIFNRSFSRSTSWTARFKSNQSTMEVFISACSTLATTSSITPISRYASSNTNTTRLGSDGQRRACPDCRRDDCRA
jgi:hypothetical protein